MINSIKSFFEKKLAPSIAEEQTTSIKKTDLACAALLIEVMNSDHELDQRESDEFVSVLMSRLEISKDEIAELITLAEAEAKQATSLYEFTSLINNGYNYEQKVSLIENMWRIAFSDKRLDKYEEHLIRKITELIYVSHSDYIRTKLKVRNIPEQ